METQCIQEQMVFQQVGRREVIGRFDGGTISSDAGGVLLREVERRCGILKRVAGCFQDYSGCGSLLGLRLGLRVGPRQLLDLTP